MKKYLILAGVIVALGAGAFVIAQGFFPSFQANLISYEEVPAVSSVGSAEFRADLSPYGNQVNWELSYRGLEGTITQSHIHFGQRGVNGGIMVFLCSNLGNGPAGTQTCPTPPATIRGTFSAGDIGAGATAQGIGAGEYAELLRAMRNGTTYANIHSTIWPGGEVRSQISLPAQVAVFRETTTESISEPVDPGTHTDH
ncbi:MAG: CHRD domain-containing protein [Acidobacteria bacterium]|nr:CHRD domain-containing protein [Acidobacteriota bacterium]